MVSTSASLAAATIRRPSASGLWTLQLFSGSSRSGTLNGRRVSIMFDILPSMQTITGVV